MCGRYYVEPDTADRVEQLFRVRAGADVSGDVTPGMSAPVLSGRDGAMGAEMMHWGITGGSGSLVINARAESVRERTMFRNSIAERRLVIPAAGFYEWDREKSRVTFRLPDSGLIFLAGLYTLDRNREAFVILTTAANRSMESMHDRMPLIISSNDVSDWLFNPGKTEEYLQMIPPELTAVRKYEQLSLF